LHVDSDDSSHEFSDPNKNRDNTVKVKTASRHRLPVTHVGVVPGMVEILVCPEISENLLSTAQLLRNGNSVEIVAGNHPHAIITTNRILKICIPLTLDDRFELPYSRVEDLIHTGIRPAAYKTTVLSETTSEQTADQEAGTPLQERIENGSAGPAEDTQNVTVALTTYTKEQKERAKKVRIIHDQLHCSDNKLKLALTNGLKLGTALTAGDLDCFRPIYGFV
jgi:hypothetical protein